MGSIAVKVDNLDYTFGGPELALSNINLSLPRGSRTLLVGCNGAGKSTLLKIISGKILTKTSVLSNGKNVFQDGDVGITYLGIEWASNPIVKRDVCVSRILKTLGAERHPERCKILLEIMDVDPNWHMHAVSEGQRRRVQIVLGLLEPWELLLLDELTVDLDVVVRARLLRFLEEETEMRGATILYATHIFDGLGAWPTHLVHMAQGRVEKIQDMSEPFPELEEIVDDIRKNNNFFNSALLTLVEKWLGDDQKALDSQKPVTGPSRWDVLSENMKDYGDRYYNYWG